MCNSEKFGLHTNIALWNHNYLTEWQQRIVITGMLTHLSNVLSGVLQGSILGFLLLLVYTDNTTDIEHFMRSSLVLCADDVLLYCPICTTRNHPALEADTDVLSSQVTHNAMTSKCKFMINLKKMIINCILE